MFGSETLNYRPLRGKLDEIRIYNEALDEAALANVEDNTGMAG